MAALTLKWEGGQSAALLALGGNNLPGPQRSSPAWTWAVQLEEGAPDEVSVLSCSTRAQDFGGCKKMGSRSQML